MSLYQENPFNEEAFEEVNNVLDDGDHSEVEVLHFKISELQKIIHTLTKTNERLIQRIEDLEEELDNRVSQQQIQNFDEEYSFMQDNFQEMEEAIKEYRSELSKYEQKLKTQQAQHLQELAKSKQENEELKAIKEQISAKLEELQEENELLLQTKDNLLGEIEELQSSLRKSKVESPRYNKYQDYAYSNRYDSQYTNDFSINVQLELQKLIQKLVKELEHERYMKKKLTEQIKQLQKDMMEQEKELIAKNNKIYSLQINTLKKHKTINNAVSDRKKFASLTQKETPKYEERAKTRDKETYNPKTKNFTLMELMNECTILSAREKLIIALKIIELYSKKLQRNDFTAEILQSLTVCNYSPSNSHLCQVKVNPEVEKDHDNEEQEQNECSLIWNLVFILDNMLSQTATKDRPFGETENEDTLLEAINYYLQNRDINSMESVQQLKKIVEDALQDQIR